MRIVDRLLVALLRLHPGRLWREERGTALVETTIMMPFLLVLSAGVFEFGNLMYQKLLIEAGLRDGARYMARCTSTATFPSECSRTIAQNIAACGTIATCTGSTSRVSGWTPADVAILIGNEAGRTDLEVANPIDPDTGPLYRGDDPIRIVEASTTFSYSGTGLLSFLGMSPINLGAAHQERLIGW